MTHGISPSTRRPLENRIPPPVACLAVGVAMGATRWIAPSIPFDANLRLTITGALALIGLLLAVSGFLAFRGAKTTVDPVKIDAASSLVTGGIFGYTRNPMYAGLTVLLTGWAVYLAVPWAILGPVAFGLFITRFQIIPEERVMRAKFGAAYEDYQKRVRRWI